MDISNYNKELKNKIKKYLSIKNKSCDDKGFSWVLSCDKEFLQDNIHSIKWGIPTYPTGPLKDGDLYVCLINPSIDNADSYDESKCSSMLNYISNHESDEDLISCFKEGKITEKDSLPTMDSDNIIYKELSASNGKLSKKDTYYSWQYFRNIVNNMTDNNKINMNEIRKLKICNLEFCPYRSTSAGELKNKREKNYSKCPVLSYQLKLLSIE
ncbi:hypothetical protein [Apilactobacillus micheneri]|uniref:hypothetical protein n=1 Tax=Apilactobacillus micheneri TaxID=1899430 RepID=UPI0011299077|nr:hypothetical protein [Apilactobacillus micheneri]TPR50742.1 hypothetical protein DY126_06750 [Apilactobacillus micheneri]